MRLQFYLSICWSIFLLCISFNVSAEERSSKQIIDNEMATLSNENRPPKRKSVLTRTNKLKNYSEFEVESIGKKELRSNKHLAFDIPPSFKQKLALNTMGNEYNRSQAAFVESQYMDNQGIHRPESIADSGLRNGKQIALLKPQLPKLEIEQGIVAPIAKTENTENPVFIEANLIQGYNELEVEGIGDAEIRSDDQIISADRIKYFQETDDIEVEGGVRVERQDDVIEGSRLKMNLESKIGEMDHPVYQLKDGSRRGDAEIVFIEGEGQYRFQQARYTTCPEGNEDWMIESDDLEMNDNDKTGILRQAKLKFLGVPIGYTPWGSFSYSGKRKTGFLAPIYSTNGRTGLDISVPFYWNIAPNVDATIKARGMSKRGIMVNNEVRYKSKSMIGGLYFDILPNDDMTEENRNRVQFYHNQGLGHGWSYRLDYSRVSDDLYFRDLGKGLKVTSRTQLLQQGKIAYNGALGDNGILSFSTQVQQFQTVQDPARPAGKPYKKLPQILMRATQRDVFGADFDLKGSYTEFSHADEKIDPNKVAGSRYTLFPNVSVPMENSFGFITPKVGLHHTGYMLNRSTINIPEKNISRTLPIMSIDSGVTFDRETKIFGEGFTQTIEPRLFYVYVPYKNQSLMPNFDSGLQGFTFGRVFSENRFSGSDRINDANQFTMALTSRLIDEETGIERFRIAVAKQFHLRKQRVGVVANPKRNSDIIVQLSGNITPTLSAKHTMQIDQSNSHTDVMRSILSYQPETGKVLNLGYRYTRGVLAQYDISGQWPISKKWRVVARKNYSLKDTRDLSEIAGFEYNACCWTARFIYQKIRTSSTRTNTTFFLQLELGGLLQIGSDPLKILTRGIPGYTNFDGRGNEMMDEMTELR